MQELVDKKKNLTFQLLFSGWNYARAENSWIWTAMIEVTGKFIKYSLEVYEYFIMASRYLRNKLWNILIVITFRLFFRIENIRFNDKRKKYSFYNKKFPQEVVLYY